MKELMIKNNDIELVQAKEVRIDSRLVAKEMGIKHKNLYELITKQKKSLREFGSLATFETEAVKKQGNRGVKHQRYYLLNENQFDLISRLARGKNHEQIIDFKIRVTKAFANSRKRETVKRESLAYYHESRDSLSTMQGVKNHHYINLAKAENKMIGLSTGQRKKANEIQLGMLICLQQIETSVFKDIDSPTEAIREVSRRFNQLVNLISPVQKIQVTQ
ncbi:Rha family transcriptional regulator [Orbus wheelerorum]|uniref:Rha family transcriptional regulator n=1 Tax=Orbus wheelerorum TaxID=3074111 RepID=UPI00370D9B24